jgi:cobaltochelatase CobN
MHRLTATPGGWTPDADGVIFIEQTPAPIVFLTAADTEIQCLAQVRSHLPAAFPQMRVTNLLQLQQQLTIDTYAEDVLQQAQMIIVRLLGGRAYWSYGLEVVKAVAADSGAALIVLPGEDRPDLELISQSTVPLQVASELWRYLTEGGIANLQHGLMRVCDRILHTTFNPPPPIPVPKLGLYGPNPDPASQQPHAGILFYRAHYLAGNTAAIDALGQALEARGITALPIFVSSLQDPDVQADLLAQLQPASGPGIDLLLNTTSFSVAKLDGAAPRLDLWQALDVPVLQVILSGGTEAAWAAQPMGLSPRDIAMNVALPEVDGRIITRAVSFKAAQQYSSLLETDVVTYQPVADRIEFVADLAANWIRLRKTPPAERRVALILANYPSRDGRLANGVGLDTPQSCLEILRALQAAGYTVGPLPESTEDLMQQLTAGVTNDPEGRDFRAVRQSLSLANYQQGFDPLPQAVQSGMVERWGFPEKRPDTAASAFAIAGIQLGNVFVGIQPSRGYDIDPSLNYHAPDLEPTHDYLAFYLWLRQQFQAQAIVHVGKHGNLEWLPGKSIALSSQCYPEACFGPLPHLYPFIVNDPGEGAQAKRRAQAVILDHLTPPLTRAELYGPLQQLEALVDEYYEAQSLDPTRLGVICDRILPLLKDTHLLTDLNLADTRLKSPADLATLLPDLDTYLCELKEAQIRDGLHIFGRCPEGRQLRDLVVAIARHPGRGRLGLTRALAADWGLEVDPLTDDLGQPWEVPENAGIRLPDALKDCRIVGDVVEALEAEAARLVETLMVKSDAGNIAGAEASPGTEKNSQLEPWPPNPQCWELQIPPALGGGGAEAGLQKSAHPDQSPPPTPSATDAALTREIAWIQNTLLPALRQTPQELTHLLRGLSGQYVPSGPAGAPTRNRPEVLPTGRNFFSVDIRAIPTESAWDVGRKAAETLVEHYVQENGEYPQTLGLSVWGTATMRTGGDDLAEALALIGVRPVWDGPSRRVVDFEVLPLSALNRPRVDVTLRISGFFRDAFPNLIDLFDQAVTAVAALEEPADQNPLSARVRQETEDWRQQGLTEEQAQVRSHYRIFGSKPGAYGAGLQGLIEAQNWQDDDDLARAYIHWSSYAYSRNAEGRAAPEAFQARLSQLQVVLHNQDNREHDLLDSDDYYQFQGGLTAAVRSIQGRNPQTYFGDHALPENPKIRTLKEEIARVYRARVVNPKWIEGVMRHGYKGAFEMAATVDYLFAYDATAHCVEDHMYEGVAAAYVLDEQVQAFVQQANPWALRDMAERLLEAHQRGLWQTPPTSTLDQLRDIAHQAEGVLESRQENAAS